MHRSSFLGSALTIWLILPIVVYGRSQDSGGVRWLVEVIDADVAPATQAVRIYGAPDELTVFFSLSNETRTPFVVTRSAMEHEVRFAVTSSGNVPVQAVWQSGIRRGGDTASVSLASETPVHVATRQTVEWTVSLRRADALPFETGRSTIQVIVKDVSTRPESAKEPSWTDHLAPASISILLIAGSPSDSPQERGAAHRQAGRKALRQGRPQDAIADFQSAVAEEPASRVSLVALGDAYLQAKRFHDAIAPLEQAMAAKPRERSSVPLQLALAYIGVDDEAAAVRALNSAGLNAERVAQEITKLREQVASRPQ